MNLRYNFFLRYLKLVMFTILCSNVFAQGVSYDLSLNPVIRRDTLFISYKVKNAGTTFAFGNSGFAIRLSNTFFNISNAVIISGGAWNDNASYSSLTLQPDAPAGEIRLYINKKSGAPGSGVNVTTTTTDIATIAIPVRSCSSSSATITWESPVTETIRTWLGSNVTSSANFQNPLALSSLCDTSITTTLRVFPNDSICKGDTVRFVVSVSTGYDGILFFRNGSLVQSGLSTTYTLIDPPTGTTVFAIARRCNCFDRSEDIVIKSDDIKVDLGQDSYICNKQKELDAGTFPSGILYQWNTGATTQKINITSPGMYSVLVYRPGGCYDRDTVKISPKNAMGYPFVTTASVTASSIQFNWNTDPEVATYQFSLDSITWANDLDFSQTVGGLTPNTNKCAWVRFINDCDTIVSGRTCATTLGTCSINYSKTKDTAVCTAAPVAVSLKNINPPSYKISWNGALSGRSTSYTFGGGSDAIIYFKISDSTLINCTKTDSIKINYVPVNDASWTGLNGNYCTASYSSILVPSQAGGTFSGPGIAYNYSINKWYFKPSVAGPGTHTITYTICGLSSSKVTVVEGAPCVSSVVSDSTSSAIQTPQGLYTDCDGQIYVSNAKNDVLSLIDTLGNARVIAGDSSMAGGYIDGNPGRLNDPIGLTVGPDGTVYFVDGGNHAVRMVMGGTVTTLAGSLPPVVSSGNSPSGSGTVSGSSARFNKPFGITMNSTYTKLYVSDQGNGRIREIDLTPPYNVRTIVGGGGTNVTNPAGVAPLSAKLYKPSHLSADSRYLYIADEDAQAIYVYDFVSNLVKPYAGIFGSSGTTTGFTSVAQFNAPSGVSVNCNGDLYVVDKNNHSIKLVDPNTYSPQKYVFNFAGGNSPIGSGDVDGPPSVARFNNPQAVSVFVKGFVDIADTGNDKIKRLSIADYSQRPWQDLQQDFTYCMGDKKDTLTPSCGGVYSGPGISTSGGVIVFNPDLAGPGAHQLTYTYTTGYCVETSTQLVRVFPKPAPVLNPPGTQVCENEFGSYALDAGTGFSTYTWYKNGVQDPSSIVNTYTLQTIGTYVVKVTNAGGCVGLDTLIIKSKPAPKVTIFASEDSICYGGSLILSTSSTGLYPIVDYRWNTGQSGTSIVAEASADYVVTATASNGCIDRDTFRLTERNAPQICITATTMTGTDLGYGQYIVAKLTGAEPPVAASVVNGNASTARFKDLWDVYFDRSGNYLYGTEEGNSGNNIIRRIRLADTATFSFAGTPSGGAFDTLILSTSRFNHPYGIVQNAAGKFYVADRNNQVIRVLDTIANTAKVLAGYPFQTGTSDGQDTLARFDDPFDVTLDELGNLYVTDYNNHKIRKISPGGHVYTFAGDTSSSPVNQVKNGIGYKANFSWPVGIGFDVMGNLYVTDEGGNTLRKISRDTVVSTLATGFLNPWNLVTDKTGNVFVSDKGNHVIKKIDKFGKVTVIAGTPGVSGYANGIGTSAKFNTPRGITLDPVQEILYVAEKGNNTIRTITRNKTIKICPGDSVMINASCSGAKAYQWSPVIGLSNGNIANPVAFPMVTTTYYLTVTDAAGCTNIDSIQIIVNNSPVVNAGKDSTICIGGNKLLTAAVTNGNPGYTYTWTGPAGIASPSLKTTLVTPVSAGTMSYVVAVTDTFGCRGRDTVVITVDPLPVANAGQDKSTCSNVPVVNLSGTVTAVTGGTWTSSGAGTIANANALATTYTIDVSDITTGTVTLTLTTTGNGACSADTDDMIISINPAPVANAGTDTTLCLGASKTLGAGPGSIAYSYSWTPVTGMAAGANLTANPIVSPALANTYNYTVTVTDKVTSCSSTDLATVIVNPVPVAYAGQDRTICDEDTTVLGPSSITAGESYSWSPASALSNPSVYNPKAYPSVKTDYLLTVTNSFNCTSTDNVSISVNPKPSASFTVSGAACATDTTWFTNTSSVSGGGSISSSWNFGDGSPVSAQSNPFHIFQGGGPYKVMLTVISNNGCSDTTSMVVTPFPKPIADFTFTVPCAAGPVSFDDITSATIVAQKWNMGDGTILTGDPVNYSYSSTGIYNVSLIVTDNNSCKDTVTKQVNLDYLRVSAGSDASICLGDTMAFNAVASGGNPPASGYQFSWSGSNIVGSNLTSSAKANPSTGGSPYTYTVTVSDGNCTSTDDVVLTVAPLPTVDAGPAILGVCEGKTVTLGGSPTAASPSGIQSVTWSPATWLSSASSSNPSSTPLLDTSYVVTVKDNNGCVNNDTIRLKINPLPDVSIAQNMQKGCTGSNVVLSVNSSNSSNTVTWKDPVDAIIASGLTANVNTEGNYKAVVVDPVTGCSDSSSVLVDFIDPPAALSITAPSGNCINEPVILVANASGDSLKYQWSTLGLGSFSDSTVSTTQYVPDPSDATPLFVTVSVWNSCDTLTASASVTMFPAPVGSFIYSPVLNMAYDTLTFTNTSDTTLYNIKQWNWDFGDGAELSSDFHSSHVFLAGGVYNVVLTVTNNFGCSQIATVPVEVKDMHIAYVPTVFSPYASNQENRYCKVYGLKIAPEGFSFSVYNRWGQLIYESSDFHYMNQTGWDGTDKNKEVQSMGVYTYVLKAQWLDGKSIDKTGTITIVR